MAWQEQAYSQKNTQRRIQTFSLGLFQKALASDFPAEGGLVSYLYSRNWTDQAGF
jgi:hypothetical protein